MTFERALWAARVRLVRSHVAEAQLLEELMAYIKRYMVLGDAQLLVTALWVFHTHCIEHVAQTPYLAITSPDSECGKSRFMEVLELVTRRAWMIIRPSDAVVYRYVDQATPTMLLDETDAIFDPKFARNHEGLRAILDAGHRRGARVPRSTDFGKGVEHFSPFCPKALAGIGTLPDTIARRSLYIRLARKKPDEVVDPFILRDVGPQAAQLAARLAAWGVKRGAAAAEARPAMPEELTDRMREGCESLVAIADMLDAGVAARAALVELLTSERLDSQETIRTRLLRDIRTIWLAREAKRERYVLGLPTITLIQDLCAIEEAQWGNYYGRGNIEPNDIASLLRHYNIKPQNIKMKDKTVAKGYRRDGLHDAWERYLDVHRDGAGDAG